MRGSRGLGKVAGMRTTYLASTVVMGLRRGVAACGSDTPTIDQVKTEFENPSGSTSDKESLISANEKTSAATPATRVAGNGNVFSASGLTAQGKALGIERLQGSRMFAREYRALSGFLDGSRELNLEEADASACKDKEELDGAVKELFVEAILTGSGKANFSYNVDVSKCTGGEVTGNMAVEGTIELSENHMKFEISQTLTNVCETIGQKACVTGEFVMEIAANSDDGNKVDTGSFTTAWFVDAEWDESGKRVTGQAKGGMRAKADGNTGAASLEYLLWVKRKDGTEVTYVLKVAVDGEGNGTLEIRGKDGELVCTVKADGSGMCTAKDQAGSAEVTWTADEAKVVAENAELQTY